MNDQIKLWFQDNSDRFGRTRIWFAIPWSLLWLCIFVGTASSQTDYQSPYKMNLSIPISELCAIDNAFPRNDKKLESTVPYEEWYSDNILKEFKSWGPRPRHYPALEGYESIPETWKRQRVLAVASNMIGLPYQHHHIPDWEPPPDWPWKTVAYGRNSKGLDCSNFTSWVYNYGLGIHINSDVHKQAQLTEIEGPGGVGQIEVRVIRDENGFDDLVSKLRAGDLLFIKSKKSDDVSHVIIWAGEFAQSPDGAPLIIDCTGSDHKDSNGNQIPIGVHLRPFTRDSWYYQSFSHAHRIIRER